MVSRHLKPVRSCFVCRVQWLIFKGDLETRQLRLNIRLSTLKGNTSRHAAFLVALENMFGGVSGLSVLLQLVWGQKLLAAHFAFSPQNSRVGVGSRSHQVLL